MAKKSSRIDTPSSQLSDEALSAASSSQPAKKGLRHSTVAFAQSQSKRQRTVAAPDPDQCQPHEPNSTNLHSSPGDSAIDSGSNCRHRGPNIDASNTNNNEDNGNDEDEGKGGRGGEVKDDDQDMHEFVLTLPPPDQRFSWPVQIKAELIKKMLELGWSGSLNASHDLRARQHCDTVTSFAAQLLRCECDDNLRKRVRKLFSNLHSSWKKEGLLVERGGVLVFLGVWDAASRRVVLDRSRLPQAASGSAGAIGDGHPLLQRLRDVLDELDKVESLSDPVVLEAVAMCCTFSATCCREILNGVGRWNRHS